MRRRRKKRGWRKRRWGGGGGQTHTDRLLAAFRADESFVQLSLLGNRQWKR